VALRGVLFDLDGTLADTASAEREAWPKLAALLASYVPGADLDELHSRYHAAFERHWVDYLSGRIGFADYRRRRLAEALAPWGGVDDALFEAYRLEKRRALERLRLFEDAVATLRILRRAGLPVCLLTNGPSELQRAKLAITMLEPELDAIAISEEIGAAKPDAAAFRHAAGLIGCSPAEVAMVGDSPEADIAGATGAGVPLSVLVTRGLDVFAEGAAIVETLDTVPHLLGVALPHRDRLDSPFSVSS
jgi:putative hydrolase of the HAD superfamily